jgi:hypothetical protein
LVLGLLGLALLVLLYIYVCAKVDDLTVDDNWGIELGEDGVVFWSGEERHAVPWSGIRRIGRFPLVEEQFVLATPLRVRRRRGPVATLSEIPLARFEKHWRRGRIGAVIRRYAPQLLDG